MDEKVNGSAQALDDEDLSTTAPNPRPSEWRMPEPVFRKTSGRLPRNFEREYFTETPTQESPKPSAVETPFPDSQVVSKPAHPTLKIILVVLGLLAMVAFIAVFLTVVYFMFLR
jgi:hypothetical protein